MTTIDKLTINSRKFSIIDDWTMELLARKSSFIGEMNTSKIPTKIFPINSRTKQKCRSENSTRSLNSSYFSQSYKQYKTSPRYHIKNNSSTYYYHRQIVITTIILAFLSCAQTSHQQSLCPRVCSCDENNLEIVCKEDYGASGIPHTLNPGAKRIIINNAQMSQFSGLDYLDKLETLDLAHNKLTIIDFYDLGKSSNFVSLNISHNSIQELKDSIVSNALSEHGFTAPMFQDDGDSDSLKPLKKLAKINVMNFVVNHNHIEIVRDLSFMRWHRLQNLDLSFNWIKTLEPLSLFGLNKLEYINLRGNLLKQVPTLALHSTISSLSSLSKKKPSTIKYLYLSENALESIQSDSFGLLEKTQELYLESCSLKSIHEQAFKGLFTLNLLSLDKNNLNEVPSQSFSYLPLLRILKMSSSNITSLKPESFSSLVDLEELQMNYALLFEIKQRVFDGLDSLRRLEIAHNPSLKTIESGAFDKLTNLIYLNLNSNSLASLTSVNSGKLSKLDLRNNPLTCGCDLKWLTRWLRKMNETTQLNQPTNSRPHDTQNHYGDALKSLTEWRMTNELLNLTCAGPPALAGKVVSELPENKLECLKPNSDLNVHIGFATLFAISFLLTFVCLLNFCRNKKHLFVILKENLVQNRITMMMPYNENLHKNVDELKKETQLYSTDYESVDYNQRPVYPANCDQVLYYEPQQYSQHI